MKKNKLTIAMGLLSSSLLMACGGGGGGGSDKPSNQGTEIPADYEAYELTLYNSGSIFATYANDGLELALTDSEQFMFTDMSTGESAAFRYNDDSITIDLANELKATVSDGVLNIYLYDEDTTISIPIDTASIFNQNRSQARSVRHVDSAFSSSTSYSSTDKADYAYFRFINQAASNVTNDYSLRAWTTLDGITIPIALERSNTALSGEGYLYSSIDPLKKDDEFYDDVVTRYKNNMLNNCSPARDQALGLSNTFFRVFEFALDNVVKNLFPGNSYIKAFGLLKKISKYDIEKISQYLVCKADKNYVQTKVENALFENIHPLIKRYNDYKADTSNVVVVSGEYAFRPVFSGGGLYGYSQSDFQPVSVDNLYIHDLNATNTVINEIHVKVPRRIELVHVKTSEGIGASETRNVLNKKVSVKVGSNPSLKAKESGEPASNDIQLVVSNSDNIYSETYTVSGSEIDSNGYAIVDIPSGPSGSTDIIKASYIGTVDAGIQLESKVKVSMVDYQVAEASCPGYTELSSDDMTWDEAVSYCSSLGMTLPSRDELISIGGSSSLAESCGWDKYAWVWSGDKFNSSTAWAVPGRMDGLSTTWGTFRNFSVSCKMK